MIREEGLIYKAPGAGGDRLRLGAKELSWLQEENSYVARARRRQRTRAPGLIIPPAPDGRLGKAWKVYEDPVTAGNILIGGVTGGEQSFVDVDGYEVWSSQEFEPFSLTPPKSPGLAVPNDNTWYTVMVRRGLTSYEDGTLSLTASSTALVGVGTAFTRYTGKNDENLPTGTKIDIDTADRATVAGTYELQAVASDTGATTIETAAATETGVPFRIRGEYFPVDPATPMLQQRFVPQVVLVASSREPGAPGGAVGDLILADVKRTAGTLTVIDRRYQNLYRAHGSSRSRYYGTVLSQTIAKPNDASGGDFEELRIRRKFLDTFTLKEVNSVDVCRGEGGSMLAVVADDTNGVQCYAWDQEAQTWGSAVSVDASGVSAGIIPIDDGSGGIQHVCAYEDSNQAYVRTSTDNGATWSAATLVWDPTNVDVNDTVTDVKIYQLQNNRIWITGFHEDNSASSFSIRGCFSDDYLTSWDTNSDNGHEMIPWANGPNGRHSMRQCPVSGRVYLVSEGTFGNGFRGVYSTDKTFASGYTNMWATSGSWSDPSLNDERSPSLWVSPDETVHLVYGAQLNDSGGSGGYVEVKVASFEFLEGAADELAITDVRRIIRVEDSAGASSTSGAIGGADIGVVGIGQSRSGSIMAIFNDIDLGGSPNDHIYSMDLIPTLMPIANPHAEELYP